MRCSHSSGHNGRVSIELPPISDLQHMLDRLKANDIAWFQEKYKAGHFAWLKDRWPASDYEKMGERIEAGDLWWVRDRLAGLDINGVQMFSGLARTAEDADGTPGLAAATAAGLAGTAALAGAAAATGASKSSEEKKKRKGGVLLLPLVIIGGLLMGLVLTKCVKDNRSDGGVVVETTAVAAETVAETSPATDETITAEANLDLVDMATGNSNISTFLAAVNAAGFGPALKAEGPLTVFAPSNEAFEALPPNVLDALTKPENKEALVALLSQHVVPGKLMAADLKPGELKSVNDQTVAVAADGSVITLNGSMVTQADLVASNGVLHVIDTVMLPVGFDADKLLGSGSANKDIVDTAASAGNLSRFGALVVAANLTDAMGEEGPFTLFAPTDEAFAKLPVGAVEALAKPENKEILTKLLSYHVVAGAKKKADLLPGDVATIASDTVKFTGEGDAVKVNDAMIVTPDLMASNGVVHAIDTVLLPPGFDLASLGLSTEPAVGDPATTNAAGDAVPEGLTVYFASGKSDLNAEAQAKIAGAVAQLSALSAGVKVDIVGHADNTGNAAKNQALSEQRAENVLAALKDGLGDKAANFSFTTAAKGDADPVDNLEKSRRVTIEIKK